MNWFEEAKLEHAKILAENADRILKTKMRVTAIHFAGLTTNQIKQRLHEDPEWSSLSIDYLTEITAQLFVVEFEASDLGITKILLNDMSQANDEGQAPFLEKYFDPSDKPLSFEKSGFDLGPSLDNSSSGFVRFYMHYFDPQTDFVVGDRKLPLPIVTPMPDWLAKLMPYQPPN